MYNTVSSDNHTQFLAIYILRKKAKENFGYFTHRLFFFRLFHPSVNFFRMFYSLAIFFRIFYLSVIFSRIFRPSEHYFQNYYPFGTSIFHYIFFRAFHLSVFSFSAYCKSYLLTFRYLHPSVKLFFGKHHPTCMKYHYLYISPTYHHQLQFR